MLNIVVSIQAAVTGHAAHHTLRCQASLHFIYIISCHWLPVVGGG